MSWLKVPETDPRFPKWLKRENLIHDFTRDVWLNDECGCVQMCLEGLKPKKKHACDDLQTDILEDEPPNPVQQDSRHGIMVK
jgi:hypothetical protein